MVKVENLSFSYNKDSLLLDNLSLTFLPEKVSVILGRNGAGKSTLLKCLCKALKPQQGKVLLYDKDISLLNEKQIAKKIAVVRQESHYIFPYTVLDIVQMGRTPHLNFLSVLSEEDRKIAYESLEMVGMQSFAYRKIQELSSGEKQMVLLARALCQSPQILLLDEPNTHLDLNNQWNMLSLLSMLCKEKKWTVIAVIHLPEIAYWLADYVFMLHKSKLAFSGPTKDVMIEQNLSTIYEMPMKIYALQEKHIALVPKFKI